jgi:hypothetical protein
MHYGLQTPITFEMRSVLIPWEFDGICPKLSTTASAEDVFGDTDSFVAARGILATASDSTNGGTSCNGSTFVMLTAAADLPCSMMPSAGKFIAATQIGDSLSAAKHTDSTKWYRSNFFSEVKLRQTNS